MNECHCGAYKSACNLKWNLFWTGDIKLHSFFWLWLSTWVYVLNLYLWWIFYNKQRSSHVLSDFLLLCAVLFVRFCFIRCRCTAYISSRSKNNRGCLPLNTRRVRYIASSSSSSSSLLSSSLSTTKAKKRREKQNEYESHLKYNENEAERKKDWTKKNWFAFKRADTIGSDEWVKICVQKPGQHPFSQ